MFQLSRMTNEREIERNQKDSGIDGMYNQSVGNQFRKAKIQQ